MEDRITLDGKTYISSKRAAQVGGYTKDYIGQMCRSGKLDAKLLGRNWYINEDSLKSHKGNKNKSKVSIERESISYTKEVPSYKVMVDDRPLNPTPIKTKKIKTKVSKQYKIVSRKPIEKRRLPVLRLTIIVILLIVIVSTLLTEGKIVYNSDSNNIFAGLQFADLEKLFDEIKLIISE